jgi:peroxiredoxin
MNIIKSAFTMAHLGRLLVLLALLGCSHITVAQDFVWAPDFPVGSTIPVLDAPDQNGVNQTLASLASDKGLMLVFSRSFDWCPFCKAQLSGLVDVDSQFEALDLPIVTMTYDSIETLKLVEEDLDISFTMLHDEDIKHVNALGIRNMDYSPGEFAYGIPQPGIFLLDSNGVIKYKFAEENFRVRPDWSDVLEAASNM